MLLKDLSSIVLQVHFSGNCLTEVEQQGLTELLRFAYLRIGKLNQERNYARHYSIYCADFKRTSVAINIERNGRLILNSADCVLEDRVVPGQTQYEPFETQFSMYDIDNVIQIINQPVS